MTLRIRRGGPTGTAPPPGATYGPTDGAAAVRAGVGARTVLDPGGGISFNSSTSLQSAINANPTSSTFVCSVNTPVWNSSVSPGTKQPTIIFPGPVGQKVINGAGANLIALSGGNGVTVRGGTWQNFATTFGALVTGDDWRVEDIVSATNGTAGTGSGSGLSLQGLNNVVSHCVFHDNAIQGLNIVGAGSNATNGAVIEYCDIYNNNTSAHNPDDKGGAHKVTSTGNGWYHHNYVHDNNGFGAWWDTDNFDWLIEECVMENNNRAGFFWEANQGSVIRRNFISDNGRAGLIGGQVDSFQNNVNVRMSDNPATSANPVQFTQNIVDHTLTQTSLLGGLLLVWDHSATAARHAESNHVFGNQFWLRGSLTARIGGLDTVTTGYPVWSLDNTFSSNDYRVASTSVSYWQWGTGTQQGSAQTFAAWQGFHSSGETRQLIA